MNRRKELCRNFQRGSCQYGDRCKFVHSTQQQQKPSPFGFGVQSASPFSATNQQHQQQQRNPFGFGVQNSSQSRGTSNIGGNYLSQPQPFVNKWTRSSSTAAASTKSPKQSDSQPQVVVHNCTDRESCKRQIVEDFNQERPLWRLTCYAHNRGLQCDIVGDVSYEELQAAAYEDAKRGINLQAIVERERNLLNSKLVEFDNFIQSPYVAPQRTGSSGYSFVPPSNNSTFLVDTQKHIAPSFSSFSQSGASANVGPNIRTPSPVDHMSGPESLGIGVPFGTPQAQDASSFHSGSTTTQSSSVFHPVVQMMPASSSSTFSFSGHVDGHKADANVVSWPSVDNHQINDRREVDARDFSIWLKEEWEIGEIPEEEPPARLCV